MIKKALGKQHYRGYLKPSFATSSNEIWKSKYINYVFREVVTCWGRKGVRKGKKHILRHNIPLGS